MQMIDTARATRIVRHYMDGIPDTKGSVDTPGYIRDYVLPQCSADDVWRLADAVRNRTKYPGHVPSPATHNVEDARYWLDGWLA